MIDEKKLIEEIKEKLYPERFGERCNVLDVINAFLQVIDEQPEVDGWIPCNKDNLPEEDVLCCGRYGERFVGRLEFIGKRFDADSNDIYLHDVIAWQPLPEIFKG